MHCTGRSLIDALTLLCSSNFVKERGSDVDALIRDCVNLADSLRRQVRQNVPKHGAAILTQGGLPEESEFYERSIETWKAAFGEEHSRLPLLLDTFAARLYDQVLAHCACM